MPSAIKANPAKEFQNVLMSEFTVRKTAERAASTAEALEARNFRYDRSWKPLRPGVPDLAAAALFIVAAAGAALI